MAFNLLVRVYTEQNEDRYAIRSNIFVKSKATVSVSTSSETVGAKKNL